MPNGLTLIVWMDILASDMTNFAYVMREKD